MRVHQSNLSKLDDEGKPVLRADGKVLKGPNYQPPDLTDPSMSSVIVMLHEQDFVLSNPGWMTPPHDCLYHALSLSWKMKWKVQKVSKHRGALLPMLSDMVQDALSTSPNLIPKGHVRPSGVTASGPVSFGKIYSTLNEILRRGGIYKNGAIVLHLDLDHPDALEFIQTPRHELPWVKRCINIT